MAKLIRRLLLTTGRLVVVLTVVILSFIVYSEMHEAATHRSLAHESTLLPVPPTCIESRTTYQAGGLDTVSTWFVDYRCQTTVGQAADYLTAKLTQQGFTANSDHVRIGELYFTGKKYDVGYVFEDLPSTAVTLDTKLTSIELSVTRHS